MVSKQYIMTRNKKINNMKEEFKKEQVDQMNEYQKWLYKSEILQGMILGYGVMKRNINALKFKTIKSRSHILEDKKLDCKVFEILESEQVRERCKRLGLNFMVIKEKC